MTSLFFRRVKETSSRDLGEYLGSSDHQGLNPKILCAVMLAVSEFQGRSRTMVLKGDLKGD